mmetsp:Transcript_3775/g.6520  ORF Transcript_3775/g.6520 Transcript_3775/m.6520 type:complete len:260 (-) Transcript_3775:62-841(-)
MFSNRLHRQIAPLLLLYILPLWSSNCSFIHVASFSPSSCGIRIRSGASASCVKRHQRIFPSITHTTSPSHYHHYPQLKIQMDDENDNSTKHKIDFILEQVDPLEIRLDATLLAIYVLCRFLFYDVTTGVKQTPGWELHDAIMLLQTLSSAIVLSALWTLVGVFGTGLFQYDATNDDNNVWNKPLINAIISAPLWVLIEVAFGWPTAGVFWLESTGGNRDLGGSFLGDQEWSLLFTLMGAGFLGVGFMMVLGRYLRQYIA